MARTISMSAGWLGLFLLYLSCVPGTFYFEDSPELIACAQTFGNTHGPGYPLLMLAGKLAMLLPAGCPAFRFNLLSAACASGAAIGLGAVTAAMAARFVEGEIAALAGLFAAVIWGMSDTFWWQAVIGEKYAAFYLAFVALVWSGYVLAAGNRMDLSRRILAAFMVSGLALAHHAFSILLLPVAVLAPLRKEGLAGAKPVRLILVGMLLAGLALSCKIVYPPLRSSARAVMDWERTDRFGRLFFYLKAGRYSQAHEKRGEDAGGGGNLKQRALSAGRSLVREFPLLLIAIAPLGAAKIYRQFPGLTFGLIFAAFLNLVFMLQFPERVTRWQEPAFGVIVLFASAGLAEMTASFTRLGWRSLGAGAGVCVVLVTGIWQWERGIWRNDLSRFYAARDLGRNILASLPERAVYLGHGDTDLFPLWALIYGENFRPDVSVAGLGSVVDVNPAGVGALEILLERAGLSGPGWASLYALARRSGEPGVFIAKSTRYESGLWRLMGNLAIHRGRGLVARLDSDWRFEESWTRTRRYFDRYTLRGVAYARSGAAFDRECPRDEVGLDGLLAYTDSMLSFGVQSGHYGPRETAIQAYREATRLLEPFSGDIAGPSGMSGLARQDELHMWSWTLASGYDRLAGKFVKCGFVPRGEMYRRAAMMCRL